jgi:hypothetical protein
MEKLLILLSLAVFSTLLSCSRDLGTDRSVVRLQLPQTSLFEKAGVLSTRTECYGVNVRGPGISEGAGSCQPSLGVSAGFIAKTSETTAISLSVPRGSERTIEVFLYQAPDGQSECKDWAQMNASPKANYRNVYKVGEKSGVDMNSEETFVSISVSLPSDTLVSQMDPSCQGTNSFQLSSSGDIYNSSGIITFSIPYAEYLFMDGVTPYEVSTSGYTSYGSGIQFPPYVTSITRKPDTGQFFGLLANGKIVESLNSTTVTETCLFMSCQVPVWMESIVVSTDTLFAKDHSGQIYEITTGGVPQLTGSTVPPYITQIAMEL